MKIVVLYALVLICLLLLAAAAPAAGPCVCSPHCPCPRGVCPHSCTLAPQTVRHQLYYHPRVGYYWVPVGASFPAAMPPARQVLSYQPAGTICVNGNCPLPKK